MASLDLSRLSRQDAVVALRSYPRRFRTVLLPTDDPDVEELAYQVGPDGHSALDHVVTTTNTFVLLGRAIDVALSAPDPVVHAAVIDASQRDWASPSHLSIGDALDRLESEAGALADRVERGEPPTWNREVSVAGGQGKITAFGIVKEAVAAGSEHLRASTTAVAAARRRM